MPPAIEVEITQQVEDEPDDETAPISSDSDLSLGARELLLKSFSMNSADESLSEALETFESPPPITDRLIIEDESDVLSDELLSDSRLRDIDGELQNFKDRFQSVEQQSAHSKADLHSGEPDFSELQDDTPSLESVLFEEGKELSSSAEELLESEDGLPSIEAELHALELERRRVEDDLPEMGEDFSENEELESVLEELPAGVESELFGSIDNAQDMESSDGADEMRDLVDEPASEPSEAQLSTAEDLPDFETPGSVMEEDFHPPEDELPGTIDRQAEVEKSEYPEPKILREVIVPAKQSDEVFQEFPLELEAQTVTDILGTDAIASLSDSRGEGDAETEAFADDEVILFFGGREGLYAVSAHSGKLEWKLDTESPITSTPATGYGKVFFGCRDGRLYAVDIVTRKERWTLSTGDLYWPRFAIADYLICFGSSDGHFYAVDIDTGVINWKFQTNGKCQSAPAIDGGVVYFGSEDGSMHALELLTGRKLWSFDKHDGRLASVSVSGGADRLSSLAESLLEEAGGDVDKAFHTACQDGHADAVRVLVPRVSNINIKDKLGYTALMKAAAFGHLAVVKILLQNRANVSASGLFGETPINAADEGGHTEIVELLKAHRAK